MKITELEDYTTLSNALERIDLRFDRMDLEINRLDMKIDTRFDKLDLKVDKLKALNWLPAIVVIVASVVQVAAIVANHVWPK